MLRSDGNRAVLLHTELAAPKATRDTQGVQVMTLKAKHKVIEATVLTPEQAEELKNIVSNPYRLPAALQKPCRMWDK